MKPARNTGEYAAKAISTNARANSALRRDESWDSTGTSVPDQ
jgi:hypothetical protein